MSRKQTRDPGDGHLGGPDRRAQQLCREVERTLGAALAASDDDHVRNLLVVAVEPAPDASRLAVIVAPTDRSRDQAELQTRMTHLEKARGYLRDDIARALQRKRTPDLFFQLAPMLPDALLAPSDHAGAGDDDSE